MPGQGAPAPQYGAPPVQPPPYGVPPPHESRAMVPPPSAPQRPMSGKRRRALIVGCNYPGQSAELAGCINDAKCIEYLLTNKFGFN